MPWCCQHTWQVIHTLQAYLELGPVRVTFILDTALAVLIGRLTGLAFRGYAPEKYCLARARPLCSWRCVSLLPTTRRSRAAPTPLVRTELGDGKIYA